MFNFSEFEDSTVLCRMVFPEQEEQVFAKGQVLSFQSAWFQETFPGGRCMFLGEWNTDSFLSSQKSDSVGDQAATFLGAGCLVAAVLGHFWTFPSWRPCFLLRCVVPVAHWLPTSANRPTRQSKAPPTPLGDLLKRLLSVKLNQPEKKADWDWATVEMGSRLD